MMSQVIDRNFDVLFSKIGGLNRDGDISLLFFIKFGFLLHLRKDEVWTLWDRFGLFLIEDKLFSVFDDFEGSAHSINYCFWVLTIFDTSLKFYKLGFFDQFSGELETVSEIGMTQV